MAYGRIKGENLYKTTLTSDIPTGISSDGVEKSFTVNEAPTIDYGWVFVNFIDSTKREVIRFHRRDGNTLYYYEYNREDPTRTHKINDYIQINNVAEYVNWLSNNSDDFGYILKMEEPGLKVFIHGGNIMYEGDQQSSIDDKELTMIDNSLNYIYIDYGTSQFSVSTTIPTFPIIAEVETLGGDILTINSKRFNYVGGSNPGTTIFTGLSDTFSSYVGKGGEAVVVKSTEDGLETTNIGGFASISDIQDGSYVYAADAEASDAYVISMTPALTAYSEGTMIIIKPNTSNTGEATVNIDGLGAKTIKKNGATLSNNDMVSGGIYILVYDGTDFQLINPKNTEVGDGSDGAISGALTITGSNDTYIEKNYTTFAPGANTVTITPTNCITVIKVQGDCDLTGTTIDFSGKGTSGGLGGKAGNNINTAGGDGGTATVTRGNIDYFDLISGTGGQGGSGNATSNPGVGATIDNRYDYFLSTIGIPLSCGGGGTGGGGGEGSISPNTGSAGGAGGIGGGCLLLLVGGDLTFSGTTTNFSGTNGSNGAATYSGGGGGGGGGGAGGTFVCLYNGTLFGTNTPNIDGGTGGTGTACANGKEGGGGGAGGTSLTTGGSNGTSGNTTTAGNGGTGATGYSLISKNFYIK